MYQPVEYQSQNKVYYKNRLRIRRQKTTCLSELPEKVQSNFRLISKMINDYFNDSVDIYLFGSYLNGTWDDQSDYDIIICKKCDKKELVKIFKNMDIKIDVFLTDNKNIKSVLIK